MAGSKPGERRGGRKPGTLNKTTREHKQTIVEMAQAYVPKALKTLAAIMEDTNAPAAARVTAASSLIDRGYGKPRQPVEHEIDLTKLPDHVVDAVIAAGHPTTADAQMARRGREAETTH